MDACFPFLLLDHSAVFLFFYILILLTLIPPSTKLSHLNSPFNEIKRPMNLLYLAVCYDSFNGVEMTTWK